MKSLKLVISLTILCWVTETGFTQIVNIENQRLSHKKNGWTGSIDLWFSLVKNTNVVFQMGNQNRVNWVRDRNSMLFLTDLSMVKANNADLLNSGFEHIRYSLADKRFNFIKWESFEQAQYNRVQLIDLRMLLGTGARAIVLDRDSAAVNLGAFLMAEHEQQSDGIINQALRYSCFLSADFQFNKHAGFNCITYYQPDVGDPEDFRLSIETSFRLKINQHFSFSIVYNLFYDARPPASIPTTTYLFRNMLRYTFN